jgi:predicted nucleotidyltransferase
MGARSQRAAVLERANSARTQVPWHSSRPLDACTAQLIRAVKSRLEELYGSRLKGLILFGSRARGDFTEASDADVAIIFEEAVERSFAVKCEVIDATYDLFLDSGIIIQPWRCAAPRLAQSTTGLTLPTPHARHPARGHPHVREAARRAFNKTLELRKEGDYDLASPNADDQ